MCAVELEMIDPETRGSDESQQTCRPNTLVSMQSGMGEAGEAGGTHRGNYRRSDASSQDCAVSAQGRDHRLDLPECN